MIAIVNFWHVLMITRASYYSKSIVGNRKPTLGRGVVLISWFWIVVHDSLLFKHEPTADGTKVLGQQTQH